MSHPPSLDASTFEGLLAAVWVLQLHHEQETRSHSAHPNEVQAVPPESEEAYCISELDTTNARLVLSVLSKAANGPRLPRRVPCPQCDNECDPRCRFCVMCGNKLPDLQPTPQIESAAEPEPAREPVPPPGNSSPVGDPGNPSDSDFVYVLEDPVRTVHWGRVLLVVVSLGCVVAAGSYWRRDPGIRVAGLFHQPAVPQVSSTRPSSASITKNNPTPADRKTPGLANMVAQKTAAPSVVTKPSALIPLNVAARATRHHVIGISRPRAIAARKARPQRRMNENARVSVRASTVARATSSAASERKRASLPNPVDPAREAQGAMGRSAQTSADQKIQSPAVDVVEEAATQSSAETPGSAVAKTPRHYVPRPPPGFGASNNALSRHRVPRPPSAGGPSPNEPRNEDRQLMSDRIPRPPD